MGCSSKINYTYTNLLDDDSKNEFIELLQNVNINQTTIYEYIGLIDSYNKTKYPQTLKTRYITTYITTDVNKKLYNYTEAINCWASDNAELTDINCRIAAFVLMKDYINFDISNKIESDLLKEIHNDFYKLNETDAEKYIAVFNVLEWDNISLKFVENSPVKLISVCVQFNETDKIVVAHSGVLLNYENGIFFIEKIDPMLPFQFSEFKNKNDLKLYLENRFEKPFKLYILENDNLLVE